ncbi:hypothetical protein [Enterovibrio coralii]|uniref:hypothetical protein n=1 Tax=Enterovibrio coralii TaxID=294935 RepID=UPI001E5D8715|nr:hypothetical protein [Enterovibrio coralii]
MEDKKSRWIGFHYLKCSRPVHWWESNIGALHGAFISYHSEFVKDKEHFKNVARIVHESQTTRLQINVMMNPSRFDECYEFAKELKEELNCIIALQPLYHGFGKGGLTKRFDYTEAQDRIMKEFRGGKCEKKLPEPRGLVSVLTTEGEEEVRSSFDLVVEQKTNFVGWECGGGIENIIITFEGEIYRSWCMQEGPIGSIYDTSLNLPKDPTICHTPICQCSADICSTKTKVVDERNIIFKASA